MSRAESSGTPLASDWSDEKCASVDWSDPEDVLANRFTFLQILLFNPLLSEYMSQHRDERESSKITLSSASHEEQTALVRRWNDMALLTPRAGRWCRHCGRKGHTRRGCPELTSVTDGDMAVMGPLRTRGTAPSKIMEKLFLHQQHIERLKLLAEKKKRTTDAPGNSGVSGRRDDVAGRGGQGGRRPNAPTQSLELFADERRRSVIVRLDTQFNIGLVRVQDVGDVKFFVDSADYGVKSIAVGDIVTFKLDNTRNYPIATDVRPERPVITAEDVDRFVAQCSRATQPMRILTMLLIHSHEWYEVLRLVHERRGGSTTTIVNRGQAAASPPLTRPSFTAAVHALVELTTFIGNREPIHLPALQKFLTMTITPAPPSPAASTLAASAASSPPANVCPPFFPDLVHEALRVDMQEAQALSDQATASARDSLLYIAEQWAEVAHYVVLLRQYTHATLEDVRQTHQLLTPMAALHRAAAGASADTRPFAAAMRRLTRAAASEESGAFGTVSLLPTAAELSVPPPLASSPFSPANLPVNGKDLYNTTEEFITAQCRLLRADTFEATSRVLPAAVFHLPNYTPSTETVADVEHARVFWKVRSLGRVVTRDRDYSHPLSYLFKVEPKSSHANMTSQLHQGTTVCFATSLDETAIADNEVFWGVVSSCDSHFLRTGIIVVAPCEGSASFERLETNLHRNERAARLERSLLLETPVFMAGYASIMRALSAFVGPLAMTLPMAELIVGPQAASSESAAAHVAGSPEGSTSGLTTGTGGNSKHKLLGYIPPHCEHAFRELTKEVRGRFALDAGQVAVMQQLPTSKMLLVQGPPGTGKSFIGCRVVETYVRYKQMVASGDILQKISVDMLQAESAGLGGCAADSVDRLLPQLGPVVVITYKNHALDEFLVDLLESGLWDKNRPRVGQQLTTGAAINESTTGGGGTGASHEMFPRGRRLIRIGGRSREGRLDGHNLGSLLHSLTDKSAIRNLKERLFLLNQRLDKLTKEIQFLESGRVPRTYFERWLTTDQRQHMSFEDREAWLRGERCVDPRKRSDAVDATLYIKLLQTRLAALQAAPAPGAATSVPPPSARDAAADITEEDASLSVFQEMKREDESREYNNALHTTYLSAEAIGLATVASPPVRPASVPEELLSLWSLDPVVRHEYYAYLIHCSITAKAKNCLTLMRAIDDIVQIRNHAVDEAKLSLLRGADVVGLTTTGCAMNQNLLRSLRPSVLVVEEAAEVLESQLLACMTDSLEQIVLIGDHYQLQPKVDTFTYEKINHLNLSLFERLARQSAPIRLTEQRRMHPTLSQLVRPFYDDQPLIDHSSVLTRPFLSSTGQPYVNGVPGLAKRVFFWRHDHPEEEAPGSRSKVNVREIRMVQQIALHLVAEGVSQSSITVITPYLGQTRMLRSVMRISSLTDVRVSTVDLYQGDENDVIILSMTRTEKLTEFIRMRNRLIVSCSRARFAMVLVGNDALLRQCAHWAMVLGHLDASACVGDKLPVTYRDRPGEVVFLEAAGVTSASKLESEIESGLALRRVLDRKAQHQEQEQEEEEGRAVSGVSAARASADMLDGDHKNENEEDATELNEETDDVQA